MASALIPKRSASSSPNGEHGGVESFAKRFKFGQPPSVMLPHRDVRAATMNLSGGGGNADSTGQVTFWKFIATSERFGEKRFFQYLGTNDPERSHLDITAPTVVSAMTRKSLPFAAMHFHPVDDNEAKERLAAIQDDKKADPSLFEGIGCISLAPGQVVVCSDYVKQGTHSNFWTAPRGGVYATTPKFVPTRSVNKEGTEHVYAKLVPVPQGQHFPYRGALPDFNRSVCHASAIGLDLTTTMGEKSPYGVEILKMVYVTDHDSLGFKSYEPGVSATDYTANERVARTRLVNPDLKFIVLVRVGDDVHAMFVTVGDTLARSIGLPPACATPSNMQTIIEFCTVKFSAVPSSILRTQTMQPTSSSPSVFRVPPVSTEVPFGSLIMKQVGEIAQELRASGVIPEGVTLPDKLMEFTALLFEFSIPPSLFLCTGDELQIPPLHHLLEKTFVPQGTSMAEQAFINGNHRVGPDLAMFCTSAGLDSMNLGDGALYYKLLTPSTMQVKPTASPAAIKAILQLAEDNLPPGVHLFDPEKRSVADAATIPSLQRERINPWALVLLRKILHEAHDGSIPQDIENIFIKAFDVLGENIPFIGAVSRPPSGEPQEEEMAEDEGEEEEGEEGESGN